jgi:hypothetical protein
MTRAAVRDPATPALSQDDDLNDLADEDPTSTKFLALMGGLGFRGISQKKHILVGARAHARPGNPQATTDDVGNRCRLLGLL